MTQDNKTSSFLKAINKYAQQQSDAILKEAEEFRQKEIERATKEAITDAYTLIQKNITVEQRTGIAVSIVFVRVYCRQQIATADRFRKSLDA